MTTYRSADGTMHTYVPDPEGRLCQGCMWPADIAGGELNLIVDGGRHLVCNNGVCEHVLMRCLA